MTMRRFVLLLSLLLLPAAALAQAQPYDILFRNARVLDGMGNPWIRADVAVRGDRIAAVGRLDGAQARRVIDATGLYIAPGFIDPHTHAGASLDDPQLSAAEPLLAEGVTTILANPDGGGPVDLAKQGAAIMKDGVAVNVGLMIGHGSVRQAVMGMADRDATPAELDRMRALVRKAMEQGAYGLSSGLFYTPGSFAPNSEVIELAKVVGEYDGVYQSHPRDESDYTVGVVASADEVIDVARQAHIPGVITHIKVLGPHVWGYSAAIIERVNRAREQGVQVYADQYPYLASATALGAALLPRWAQADGRDAFLKRLDDPATLARIRTAMADNLERRGGAERIQFRRFVPDPSIEGHTLAWLAMRRGADPLDVALDLLRHSEVSIVSFNMNERDVQRFMRQPWTMTSSDGSLPHFGVGVPHPRSYGSFPRKIRKYALEDGVIDLPFAIRSMTSLTAEVYRLKDRGQLRPGAYADLAVFDLGEVNDPATYTKPHQLARGMIYVLVNGRFAVDGGEFTGERPGRLLKRVVTTRR
ncbi:MAG: D-aminoacylase [Gemmatimonadota bacterium]|jgi:N-acyl-D-amino-acid deacylase